jgi:hypothetical protein
LNKNVKARTLKIPKLRGKESKTIYRLNRKKENVRNLLFNLRKVNLIKNFSSLPSYFSNSKEKSIFSTMPGSESKSGSTRSTREEGKLSLLCEILSNKFNKPVELQLIRLHHPYHDSNILGNLLSLNIKNKRKSPRVAIEKIYNKGAVEKLIPGITSINNIPNFLSGLNIQIAGRLMREAVIPRITTKVIKRGATSPGKVNYLDTATITNKNRKGAYTITIKSGQNFFYFKT